MSTDSQDISTSSSDNPLDDAVKNARNLDDPSGPKNIGTLALAAIVRARARWNKTEAPVPVPWEAYANIIGGGLWPGMHVLVGGTGSGKTTWTTQIAVAAAEQGFPVAYVGLELDEMQIGLRMVAERNWSKLYLGKCSEAQMEQAEQRARLMETWSLVGEMGDPSGWPASRLESLAKRLQSESKARTPKKDMAPKPGLIVLDFLQLVGDEVGDHRADLRERIGKAAYRARQVAREYNVAIVLVSSTARANYDALAKGAKASGLAIRRNSKGEYGILYNPDNLIGTGKESGEIEYAADSLTVLVKLPNEYGAPIVLCCVPKLRYGPPRWFPMAFEDQNFRPLPFDIVNTFSPKDDEGKALDLASVDDTCKCSHCGHEHDTPRITCAACGRFVDPLPKQTTATVESTVKKATKKGATATKASKKGTEGNTPPQLGGIDPYAYK